MNNGCAYPTPFPAFPRSEKASEQGKERVSSPVERFCFLFDGGGWEGVPPFDPRLHSRYTCRMSIQLIQQYHAKVEKIIRYGGSRNESALRKPFQDLLEAYAAEQGSAAGAGGGVPPRAGCASIPDGTLKDALRQDWGYWESRTRRTTWPTRSRPSSPKAIPPPTSCSKTRTPPCCTRTATKCSAPILPTPPRSMPC